MELWPVAAYAGVRKLFQLSDVLRVCVCVYVCGVMSTCKRFGTRLFVIVNMVLNVHRNHKVY